MHYWILKILIVAMLFVSMESVADFADEASFHQTHHAHVNDADDANDAGDQWFPDADGQNHEGDSCQHVCHAHVVALTAQVAIQSMPKLHHDVPSLGAHANTRAAAPPTPPPNI